MQVELHTVEEGVKFNILVHEDPEAMNEDRLHSLFVKDHLTVKHVKHVSGDVDIFN